MCWASKKFSSRRHIWAYSKFWQQVPTGRNYPEETWQVTFLTLDPQGQRPPARQLSIERLKLVQDAMELTLWKKLWSEWFGKSPSTCVWLRSEGSVELCGLWISLPLGSSDDFCGQWGWAATWGQVSPFGSLLLLPDAGSKSRCVESEEHQPSPRAVIEPTDGTWQADSSSEFSLFLPYDKNGRVGHKA